MSHTLNCQCRSCLGVRSEAELSRVDLLKPFVRLTPGGWLATEELGRFPDIGVMGRTRADAVANFAASRRKWLKLMVPESVSERVQ